MGDTGAAATASSADDHVLKKNVQGKKTANRPTQEQIDAKRKERAEKKQREAAEKERQAQAGVVGIGSDGKAPFALRKWSAVRDAEQRGRRVRIISWNILAQGLVRRKLFPGSDCLKWKSRESGLKSEMVSHNWDIAAFQEVDRIDAHGPNLEQSGRSYVYAKGYEEKQHGLMIAWRTSDPSDSLKEAALFEKKPVESKVIFFDREHVDATSNNKGTRLALSRVTRNIALFVALRFKAGTGGGPAGIVLATTHLFWHPMHAYERVRQMGIMKRQLLTWRDAHPEWSDWPMVVAGDFNDQPDSATYKLVVGEPMTQHCLDEVKQSCVVHTSVDELSKMVANDPDTSTVEEAVIEKSNDAQQEASGPGNVGEEPRSKDDGDDDVDASEEGGEADEEEEDDQVLKNCRVASEQDGLLSFEELLQLHDLSRPPPGPKPTKVSSDAIIGKDSGLGLTSLYGKHFNNLEDSQESNYFGSAGRGKERHDDESWTSDMPNPHLGSSFEPMYTLYSPLFCLTLDYLFLFPPVASGKAPVVSGLLPTHRTDVLAPGVPRLSVCASDHVAIGAELRVQ